MDSFGVFADGEWESFSKMFSNEEFDFTRHDDQGLHFLTPSTFCPTSEANESLFYSSNLHNLSQDSTSFGSNCSTSVLNIPTSTNEACFFSDISNHIPVTNDVSMFMAEENISSHGITFPDIAMEETCPGNQYMNGGESQATTAVVAAKELQLKRKFDEPALFHSTGEGDRVLNVDSTETNAKKKPRASKYVPKSKKKNVVLSKKNQNQNVCPKGNEREESINGGSDGQSSTSTYNSEDENASQETNNEESKAASLALNLNGKPRASRGSATDPQSLYARKRRERINERLKILQNLVPNGTKVDISTMLEEAVHYVKFMQLQIKLLSSDDLWMYAPLAYNGVDVCLHQKISSFM